MEEDYIGMFQYVLKRKNMVRLENGDTGSIADPTLSDLPVRLPEDNRFMMRDVIRYGRGKDRGFMGYWFYVLT